MNSLKSISCTALAALVLAVSCNTPKPEETRQDKLTAYLAAFMTGYNQEEHDALVEAFPFE